MTREIIRAESLDHALELYRADPAHTRFLAGGTQLHRLGGDRKCSREIVLQGVTDGEIRRKDKKTLTIGAAAVFQDLADHPEIPPVLKDACLSAQSRTLRQMATIGGNIAAGLDESYLLPALAVLNARVRVYQEGSTAEEIPVEAFREGLITHVIIPDITVPAVQRRISRSSQTKAAVTAACSWGTEIRAAVSAVRCGLVVLQNTGALLDQGAVRDDQELADLAAGEFDPGDDFTGSREYKQYTAGVLLGQFLRTLIDQKRGG